MIEFYQRVLDLKNKVEVGLQEKNVKKWGDIIKTRAYSTSFYRRANIDRSARTTADTA